MKIAIDTSPLESGHQGRGVGTYTRGLVAGLKQSKTNLELVFSSKPRETDANLIHYPYFDLFFHTLPYFHTAKIVVTVHDVIPLLYPDQFPPGIKGRLKCIIQKQALQRAAYVITDSMSSKKDIINEIGIPEHKISVIYLAADANFKVVSSTIIDSVLKKYDLPPKYFLYVGDINYNKNLHSLITAIGRYNKIPLYIVTRSDLDANTWEAQTATTTNLIKQALKSLPNKGLVTFFKIDSQTDLNAVYSGATAYIQPSLYEGFGLPVLEALASGTLVACSNVSSLPEVGESAVVYFQPEKIDTIISSLDTITHLSLEERQKRIKEGLHQTQKFTWKKTALETIEIYKKVLKIKH